ncbi:hypothetical protein QUB70_31935, partial [Microcoleus sp. A003_D6]|uniref:hypothetical protein n=1 Tax=Microcoleus sp. A003_D6 TaxID=3055266 RepID=UPI002FD62C3B
GRRKKEEGRRKKEEGRRKKEEGRRKREEGRHDTDFDTDTRINYRGFLLMLKSEGRRQKSNAGASLSTSFATDKYFG